LKGSAVPEVKGERLTWDESRYMYIASAVLNLKRPKAELLGHPVLHLHKSVDQIYNAEVRTFLLCLPLRGHHV